MIPLLDLVSSYDTMLSSSLVYLLLGMFAFMSLSLCLGSLVVCKDPIGLV